MATFKCDYSGCNFITKYKSSLPRHKAAIHGINVKYTYCDQDGCDYKTKHDMFDLKKHKMYAHDILFRDYFYCDEPGCNYRCIESLHKHKKYFHDIGNNLCDICYENKHFKFNHHDKHGNHNICKSCYKVITGKESRIEHIWSDYIDKYFGTDYLSSSDKSMKSNGGCQLYRPDKLYISDNTVLLCECDENQHKYNNGDYTCDEKRISDIYDELGINGKRLIVIRWNPDNYNPQENTKKKNKKERLKKMVEIMKQVIQTPSEDIIHIYYLFYDNDNKRISKRLPRTLIY
jgi:hypothetical protein|tara:strand:+ start:1028 stop:1894 length:867 start_codon:yes stop_codon:yes gene_type:complete